MARFELLPMLALGALLANAQGSFPGARRTSRVSEGVVAEEAGIRQTDRTLLDFRGIVESLAPHGLVLATADGRKLEFTCTRETKYRRGDKTVKRQTLSAGVPATITGWQSDQYFLFAVRVQVGVAETQAAKPPAARSEPIAAKTDPRIEKALLVAEEFTASLASYVVRQVTTRHAGNYLRSNWRLLDVVSAEVAYENGKETYRNIRLNDKPVNQSLEQISGLVTQGEFGNILGALFARESRADFTPGGSANFQGRPAWRYEFTVRQPHSQWRTKVGSHALQLAYKGSLWLDQETLRVLHIEIEGQEIPDAYPMAAIEWGVSYASVQIGGRQFLVPAQAESLACWRGTLQCHRNTTQFRDYHRFTGESRIYPMNAADAPPVKPH